ncbi:MAG: YHS domain-containing (seleno)protein [Marinibacterium sp.]
MYRRQFIVTIIAALAAVPARAMGAMFFSRDGVALEGFDTVSYHSGNEPVRGRRDIAVTWKGAIWQFASANSRDRFESDPWAYAPRYGAYCAYSLAMGRLSPGDPQSWRIVAGELYVMANEQVKEMWAGDSAAYIARADANWPAILYEL